MEILHAHASPEGLVACLLCKLYTAMHFCRALPFLQQGAVLHTGEGWSTLRGGTSKIRCMWAEQEARMDCSRKGPTPQRRTTVPVAPAALPAVMTGRMLLPKALQQGKEQAARQEAVTQRTVRVSVTVALWLWQAAGHASFFPQDGTYMPGFGLLIAARRWQCLTLLL